MIIMDDFKTFDSSSGRMTDPLLIKQRQDVTQMRASLLACGEDSVSSMTALQNITVLRVYHQIARIIKYLDMMDKIEEKLYESIDYQLDMVNIEDMSALSFLINLQEKLQKNLIDSHKLLQPYLNIEELNINNMITSTQAVESNETLLIPKTSRDKLRLSAQQVLDALDEGDEI